MERGRDDQTAEQDLLDLDPYGLWPRFCSFCTHGKLWEIWPFCSQFGGSGLRLEDTDGSYPLVGSHKSYTEFLKNQNVTDIGRAGDRKRRHVSLLAGVSMR